jgi:hypothetical protein
MVDEENGEGGKESWHWGVERIKVCYTHTHKDSIMKHTRHFEKRLREEWEYIGGG